MPATASQSKFVADLAVRKTKEFKEVKEIVASLDIGGETVDNAESLSEILNAITPYQASKIIDELNSRSEPSRGQYSEKRIDQLNEGLQKIKENISDWDFNGLQ